MNLDAFTLSALVDEFLDTLAGGRVQDSLSLDEMAIGLEIYADHRRQYLYLSADPQAPRVHLVPEKLRRGLVRPTQLGLLVRRMVEGGSIAHISQPPYERILQIDVDGPEGAVSIIVEPMERRSNLLLVQNGIILDCLRRVGSDENRYRVSLPNHPYVLPPPQTNKHDPAVIDVETFSNLFRDIDDAKKKTQQVLSASILGLSPLLAREIIVQAGGQPDQRARDAQPGALYPAMRACVEPLLRRQWQPGIAESGGRVSAFSVYPLTHLPGWHAVETTSAALAAYYGASVGVDAYRAAKEPVAEAIQEAQSKLRGKLASLERSMTDEQEREFLRQSGELILAYQYAIAPKQAEMRAAYDEDGSELVIALDPTMTALENAQHYFDRYNRAKRALDDVPNRIRETRAELDYLAQLATDLDLGANWPEIEEVQAALAVKGHWRGATPPKSGGQRSAPLRVVTPEGFVIWVGRNSRQNEQVTFDKGSPQDLWLHVRDVPGSHVIIKMDGRSVPESVMERADSLAAYYSARRSDGHVPVDVTFRRYVRKIKGGSQGQVTYQNEQTRMAVPRSERD